MLHLSNSNVTSNQVDLSQNRRPEIMNKPPIKSKYETNTCPKEYYE